MYSSKRPRPGCRCVGGPSVVSLSIVALLIARTAAPLPATADSSADSRPACGPDRANGDIVLITVDALRPDHLGLYGYPRKTSPEIDQWFAKAAIFERAYATGASTPPTVVSLLTGLLPQEHGVRLFFQLLSDDVEVLPELLPDCYETAAFVSNVVLTDEALGMADRFDHYDDFVDELAMPKAVIPVFERRAKPTTDAVLSWLRTRRDRSRPLFLWVHFIDPHQPYDAPKAGRPEFEAASPHRYPADPPELMLKLGKNEAVAMATIDRYDEEVHYADREIGRLLSGYAELSPPDEALILFSADHGESMLEHEGFFTHGYHVYDEITLVPLMMRGPGIAAARHRGTVSSIDVTTTILAFAGVERPAGMRGVDLRRNPEPKHAVFIEASSNVHRRAVVKGRRKWIVEMPYGRREVQGTRFYDLAADPSELAPRDSFPRSAPYRRLNALVAADPHPGGLPKKYRKGLNIDAPKVAPRVTPRQLEQLRALGYVE